MNKDILKFFFTSFWSNSLGICRQTIAVCQKFGKIWRKALFTLPFWNLFQNPKPIFRVQIGRQSIAKIIWVTQLISLYTLTQQVEAIEASNSISQNQLPWCSAWDTSSLLSKAETQTQLTADLGGRRWRLSACWRPLWLLDAISVSITYGITRYLRNILRLRGLFNR